MSARFTRKLNTKAPRKVIHIYTEGRQTEPNYFNAIKQELRLPEIDIQLHPTSRSTLAIVEYAIKEKQFDDPDLPTEWWVVFDRDDHDNFDHSIELARAHGIQVAYSNESFELWFILHFEFLQSSLGRDKFADKLTKHLGQKYEKNIDMYSLIKGKESDAIRNAKNLEKQHDGAWVTSPIKRDPSTTVYQLVEQLRALKTDA